jgi:rhodanese-related sulfurtransferase
MLYLSGGNMKTNTLGLSLSATVVLTLVLLLAAVGCAQEEKVGEALRKMLTEAKAEVESVSVDDLASMITDGVKVTILDVRTESEYAAGHIDGAVWIPRGKLEFAAAGGKVGATESLIVCYCRMDSRSAFSAAALKKLGFNNVKYLKGGFMPWITGGHSIFNKHGELIVKEFEKEEADSE